MHTYLQSQKLTFSTCLIHMLSDALCMRINDTTLLKKIPLAVVLNCFAKVTGNQQTVVQKQNGSYRQHFRSPLTGVHRFLGDFTTALYGHHAVLEQLLHC
jgi:hypothetical protein